MRSALVLILVLSGCASLERPFDAHFDSTSASVRECARWYRELDAAVEAAGVRDGQYARLPGFPYLRVSRALAGVRGRAGASEPGLHAFAERLLALDLDARAHEIRNLGAADPAALQRTQDCGRLLREIDLAKPQARQAMLEQAAVPDDYSFVARAAGLYPLTRLFFASGVRRWEDEAVAAFRREPAPTPGLVRYEPPALAPLARGVVAGILGRAELDPLGQPLVSEREFTLLAATYAPSYEVPVAADYDRFGALRWQAGAAMPEVDAADPRVYVQAAYTRYGERMLLQIVYTVWFSERPPRGEPDILAGKLDGLVWRVTLAPDGAPLVYDSIHPCGCYHMFFPTPRARPRPSPDPLEEWAFIPQGVAAVGEGERPLLRVASGTHYLERVSFVRGNDSLVRYAFHGYDALRSLPSTDGRARSAFGADGLIAGSERAERFLFWPMGIASAGAMRQWGRQPTAFIGRRHFDDADLFERRFEFDL
jgi:hypothetical protein